MGRFSGRVGRQRWAVRALAAALASSLLLLLAPALGLGAPMTFTVTSTADSGPGTLRQAILNANANDGTDTIAFNIPDSGGGADPNCNATGCTITPASALPTVTNPAIINGYTQPGSSANTSASAHNGTLKVRINGSSTPQGTNGLFLTAGSSTVRGLVISGFSATSQDVGGAAIRIETGRLNTVAGNFLGTDFAGTGAAPNDDGVTIEGSSANTVGGTSPAARNLVSGNSDDGVEVFRLSTAGNPARDNTVAGNLIGTDRTGESDLGNESIGLIVVAGVGNTIGGTTASARNVISGNGEGIEIDAVFTGTPSATDNAVQGNYIGTDKDGEEAVPNDSLPVALFGDQDPSTAERNVIGGATAGAGNVISGNDEGIQLAQESDSRIQGNRIGTDKDGDTALGNDQYGIALFNDNQGITIGGTSAAARNVISANDGPGIRIEGTTFSGSRPGAENLIQGNFIGTNAAGNGELANTGDGLLLQGLTIDNTIGGTAAGAGNRISGNGSDGIELNGDAVARNSIQRNAIGPNGSGPADMGIDLGPDGVTPNDNGPPPDSDSGPNDLQNFPELTLAERGASTTIEGRLRSEPNETYRIEFFSNDTCDASGNGEGERFLGSTNVTTAANGQATFSRTVAATVALSDVVTSTATDSEGSTSELSRCQVVTQGAAAPALSVSDASLAEGNSGTRDAVFTVRRSSASGGNTTVEYRTTNGTAGAGSDYIGETGTLTFTGMQTAKQVTVPVRGDRTREPDETFFVDLSNPTNGTISDGRGRGLIRNDDAPPPPPPPSTETTCQGRPATILGTSAGETISGTSGDDVIVARGGADRILGGAGRDLVCAGDGSDNVNGESGDDRLYGQAGNDRATGATGNDLVAGDAGDDRLFGESGDDQLFGGPGRDGCDGAGGANTEVDCEG